MIYPKPFQDRINKEFEYQTEFLDGNDEQVFHEMLDEINGVYLNHPFKMRTFVELRSWACPKGVGNIIAKYINKFESERAKSELLCHLYNDKVPNRDRIIMDLYHKFRETKYHMISTLPSNTDIICIYYDTAFFKIKSKKLLPELIELSKSIAETRRLSVTYGMIMKKWAPPEMEQIMVEHLLNRTPSKYEMAFLDYPQNNRLFNYDVTQSRFRQIDSLSYFPSERNRDLILTYADHEYKELAKFAKKTAEKMDAKLTPLWQ